MTRAPNLTSSAADSLRVEVDGVSKNFLKRKNGAMESLRVLDQISFQVQPSEFLSIVGPSGCGKTSLLRLIAGLMPVDQGVIRVGAGEVTRPGPERAVVFQDFALLPWKSVLDNIAFGLKLRGVGKVERTERARNALALVGLQDFVDSLPQELSGGMRQRVGLARALCADPKVLLMDEPFGSLDEITRRAMQKELLRIWESQTKTVVFITHSVEEAIFLADRVLVMTANPGRIAEILTVDLPRPRTREMENSPEFLTARSRIWDLLGS
ncbi:MAG: ABC transporter ATP-binding protein [bacterium]